MTQAELGARLSVSRSAVAQWESSAGSAPATSNLAELARVLHCSFEWVATGRGARGAGTRSHTGAGDSPDIAVHMRHFARDDDEERVLAAFRALREFDRVVALSVMEQLGARPKNRARR